MNSQIKNFGTPVFHQNIAYYLKNNKAYLLEANFLRSGYFILDKGGTKSENLGNYSFYGRSSFRQMPELTRRGFGQSRTDLSSDEDRPTRYILRDERLENDLENIINQVLKDVYTGTNKGTHEIQSNFIDPINEALIQIFGEEGPTVLKLKALIPPLDGKISQVLFQKGDSEIHYNVLSAGEKEIINILLNLLSRRNFYQDTLYFFDEIDLHLNTSLPYRLLQEITEHWIPEGCQFWTASHSLGFIDYAMDSEQATVLDFDDLDFDQAQTITPSEKTDLEVFEIAVSKDQLGKILQGNDIFFAENTDTQLYNDLVLPGKLFVKANNKTDAFFQAKNLNKNCIIDRDYLTDNEVKDIQTTYPNTYLLEYYSIENYLYHPDNVEEFCIKYSIKFDKVRYQNELREQAHEIIADIALGIKQGRDGYPFYKEDTNEINKKKKGFRENSRKILEMLKDHDFEVFYRVFPIKDKLKNLPQRPQGKKKELAQTDWFREQIAQVLDKK